MTKYKICWVGKSPGKRKTSKPKLSKGMEKLCKRIDDKIVAEFEKAGCEKDMIYEFWKNYKESDFIERKKTVEKLIKNFGIIKLMGDKKISEQIKEYILANLLQSYFDDVVCYIR